MSEPPPSSVPSPASAPSRANFPRLAFAGTPAFAAHILQRLIAAGLAPSLVLTQPDRAAGRGRQRRSSPVRQAALAASIPVATPASAAQIQPAMATADFDVLVVAAYGLLLPPAALHWPRLGCINVHASLLPRWRGAAPVERALIAGDRQTGVSIMQMEEGLDTGPLFETAAVEIAADTTGAALEQHLAELGAGLLIDVLPDLSWRTPRPQQGPATYARKLATGDSVPDWERSAAQLQRQVLALAHRAPVHARLDGTRVQLLSASARATGHTGRPGTLLASGKQELLVACGAGALAIESLRVIRGKGRVLAPRDARNGFPGLFRPGARFQ